MLPSCTLVAGTGALKSGFTRTGKRTVGGMLDDGYKSVARYYLNNFQDGKKQDAVDLVTGEQQQLSIDKARNRRPLWSPTSALTDSLTSSTGSYIPETGGRPPFKRQASPVVPVAVALVAIYLGLAKAVELVSMVLNPQVCPLALSLWSTPQRLPHC